MMASSSSPSFTLSSVTVAVDKATSELLLTPDWTIILAICDSVNSHHWQGKDAVKAVKRRLQHKNAKLLEAMVKNCGEHLHSQIAEKHLLGEMVRIVRKKGDFEVRNKILILLDTWHEAFGGVACRFPHYNWAYEELRRSGVRFPERSQEAALMLRTSIARPSLAQSSSGNLLSSSSFRRLDETMATEIESLSLSSLESMRNVMDLVNEMVQAVTTADGSALKDELIVDLVDHCRSNQKKLIQMLMTTVDGEVLARGLELNDSMQGVLARHDAIASSISLPPSLAATSEPKFTITAERTSETSPDAKAGTASAAAIDPESVSSSSSSESEPDEEEEEDDDFAQLAKRHVQMCAEETEEEALLLLGKNDNTTTEPQSSQCKDLALTNQEVPTSMTKAEQDIMELLSLTISTTGPPSTQPQMNQSLDHQSSHHNQSSTEQILLNSYVVPWAQSRAEDGSPSQSQLQQKAQLHPEGGGHFESVTQFSYGYPPPPWVDGQRVREGEQQKVLDTHLQYSNSFVARGISKESTRAETGSVQKPYVPPYKLFEDLNVFWNAGGSVKSGK
ncbi:PREDICTED: target of Myb protein 1-like isoform X2 [Tarenaya hassleriana]|uniref:target of Myb protein 1-like isoform X2 n=1 Tax=Tarenaya hassleriana TaxID=28532 RepID=UPI00053CAA59|nr:PREDICTED: target of Myb protein 1-like isoform X2 [Tarenaya hassleriana]